MSHLSQDYLDFFQELEKNNTKDWFDENRKRYESSIKKPFKTLVLDVCKALQPLYPNVDLADRFSIMRINRDIRFSNDKTPYKIHMGAMIMPGGKKDKTRPGFYMQLNHHDVRVYSGSHMLEKDQLLRVRTHIAENLDEFNSLVSDKKFLDIYGDILGEKNKRLPEEFKAIEEAQPLIANKSFYWFFKLKPSMATNDKLIKELVSRYEKSLPLNSFFEMALGS